MAITINTETLFTTTTSTKATSIDIVGLGVSEQAELSGQALAALKGADIVLGSQRQLDTVCHVVNNQQMQVLPKLSVLKQQITQHQGKSVAVLASGDPLFYGIGQWFVRNYILGSNDINGSKRINRPKHVNNTNVSQQQTMVRFHPAISSVQAVCHLLGLALQDVEVVSLHGRPVNSIRSVLKRNRQFIILTDKYSQPKVLAQECKRAGLTQSTIWVCENMGYQTQRVRAFSVHELINNEYRFDPLHITVIAARGSRAVLSQFPGIADGQFITDTQHPMRLHDSGMISKREVRLNILSLLQPEAMDTAWDVGAGCGGVAVEWALWNKHGHVYAIEQNERRQDCLRANQQRFGVESNLHLIAGRAPLALYDLPDPDVIFIGGSDGGLEDILTHCWQRLAAGGRLVASAITETSKHRLQQFAEKHLCTEALSTQIAVSRAQKLAGQLVYKPALPVTLFKMVKAQEEL